LNPITPLDRDIARELLAGGSENLTQAQIHQAQAVITAVFSDFTVYLNELWIDRKLDRVAPLSEVELDIAAFIAGQTTAARRRGVLAFRGIGKTHIGPAALTGYRHGRDPNRRNLIISKAEKEAKKTCGLVREWYDQVWFLQHLAPTQGQRDASTYFDCGPAKEDRQPSLSVVGIDGQLEGNRAHSIFPDDVETKANTRTIEARDELRRMIRECKNILYPHREYADGGPIDPVEIVHHGTPKHEETLFLDLIKIGYDFRGYPIAYPRPDQKVINLAPLLADKLARGKANPGEATVPLRFGQVEIIERRAEGLIDFSMESMLIADLGEGSRYPLRLSDCIVMDVARDIGPTQVVYGTRDHNGTTEIPTDELPHDGFSGGRLFRPAFIGKEYAPFHGTKAYIDPAGRGDDRTGVTAVGCLHGLFFVKTIRGLEGGASVEKLSAIALACRAANAREIFVEDNIDVFNTYVELLEVEVRKLFLEPGEDPAFPDGWKASVERRRSTGQKELRIIAALEPVLSSHRVIFDRSCFTPEPGDRDIDALAYQLSRLTKDRGALREDGKLDSFASCIKEWQYAVAQDPDKLRAGREAKAARDHFDRLRRDSDRLLHGVNRPTPQPSWIHRRQ
jgi:hypothetical protein